MSTLDDSWDWEGPSLSSTGDIESVPSIARSRTFTNDEEEDEEESNKDTDGDQHLWYQAMQKNQAESLKEEGDKQFRAGRYEVAADKYRHATECHDKLPSCWSNLAACYGQLKQYEDMAQASKSCINADPLFVKGYYQLATAQGLALEFEECLETLNEGLAIQPADCDLNNMKYQVQEVIISQQCVRLDARHTKNHLRLAKAYLALGRYYDVQALEVLHKGMDIDPDNEELMCLFAGIAHPQWFKIEDQEEAFQPSNLEKRIRSFEEVLEIVFLHSRAQIFWGCILLCFVSPLLAFSVFVLCGAQRFLFQTTKRLIYHVMRMCAALLLYSVRSLLSLARFTWKRAKTVALVLLCCGMVCLFISIALDLQPGRHSLPDECLVSVENPYQVLGLSTGATKKDIKSAYRKLALLCHSDHFPPAERHLADKAFQQIDQAYKILKDPASKQTYDDCGHGGLQVLEKGKDPQEACKFVRQIQAVYDTCGNDGLVALKMAKDPVDACAYVQEIQDMYHNCGVKGLVSSHIGMEAMSKSGEPGDVCEHVRQEVQNVRRTCGNDGLVAMNMGKNPKEACSFVSQIQKVYQTCGEEGLEAMDSGKDPTIACAFVREIESVYRKCGAKGQMLVKLEVAKPQEACEVLEEIESRSFAKQSEFWESQNVHLHWWESPKIAYIVGLWKMK